MSIQGQMPKLSDVRPKLTVIGVGGAGCNAVNNMIASGLVGVDFVVANTDAQALASSAAEHRLQLGAELTEGLGAGSRPEIGEAAAEEAIEEIRKQVAGSHMVFIAAGMGGGTGTGAASVIARVAKELGILAVGVVTKPFLFEGARRMRIAEAGVAELRNYVDTLIVIPNQNLFRIASEKTTFSEAFVMADQVLYSGVACIVDLIIKEGLINLDFADVRTVMTGMGSAMMGTGESSGERRATLAAEEAISNPLLDDVSLKGAKGLLLSITGGKNLTLYEVDEAASRVRQEVDPEANIIVGATFDEKLGDRVRVSIVASGMARLGEAERSPPAPAEDWVRGPKPGPVPSSGQGALGPGAPYPARAPTSRDMAPPSSYPAQRAPRERQSAPDDMQRRLTEALQHASTAPPGPGAQRGSGKIRDAWRGPGNVMIEDGPPQLSVSQVPPPLPSAPYAHGGQDGFIPSAPVDVRRPQRRMPEVEDFPQVGQRAYRAMEVLPERSAGQSGGWSHDQDAQPNPPGRRLSLFERLAGRVRGDSAAESRRDVPSSPYLQNDYPPRGDVHGGDHQEHGSYYDSSPGSGHEDTDLPGVFSRRQK